MSRFTGSTESSRTAAGPKPPEIAFVPAVFFSAILIFVTIGLGPNMELAAIALFVLVAGCILLWRPGEPPILLFIFCMQWLEASLAIFYSNIRDADIGLITNIIGANIWLATLLSLIGLLFLAMGIRLAAGPTRSTDVQAVRLQISRIPQKTWLLLFLIAFASAFVARTLAPIVPGLSQPILALANLKWAAYVMLTYVTFTRSDASRLPWVFAFGFEFLSALGGYFSSFRLVFQYTLLAMIAANVRWSLPRTTAVVTLALTTLILGAAWTAIKADYRTFANGGRGGQAITVGKSEQLFKIVELTSQLDKEKMLDGLDEMAHRLMYVQYFGAATNFVPAVVAHQNGALWLESISRPFMPRQFFPNKSEIDESALTNKYTGTFVAGKDRGTQISIGYIGESYIDFGKYGMMIAMLILGLFIGYVYKWLLIGKYSRGILGIGLAPAILMWISSVGNSSAKIVGALVASILVTYLLNRIVVPVFAPWLRA